MPAAQGGFEPHKHTHTSYPSWAPDTEMGVPQAPHLCPRSPMDNHLPLLTTPPLVSTVPWLTLCRLAGMPSSPSAHGQGLPAQGVAQTLPPPVLFPGASPALSLLPQVLSTLCLGIIHVHPCATHLPRAGAHSLCPQYPGQDWDRVSSLSEEKARSLRALLDPTVCRGSRASWARTLSWLQEEAGWMRTCSARTMPPYLAFPAGPSPACQGRLCTSPTASQAGSVRPQVLLSRAG